MSKTHHMSAALARRLALRSQLLCACDGRPRGKPGTLHIIEHLGYVQVDAMSVVERAQHHTLWTRQPDYKPDYLHELQRTDRSVFEYWGHCASYLPMCDYRYYLAQMQSQRTPTKTWPKRWLKQHGHLMTPILRRIHDEGPLSLRQIEEPTGVTSRGWSSGSPTQIIVDMLCGRGDLMITERRGRQKIYDLRENVVPDGTDTSMPTRTEQGEFFVRRALKAHGLAQERTIHDHLRRCDKKAVSEALSAWVDSGEAVEVTVEGIEGGRYYALAKTLDEADGLQSADTPLCILSPFDNLIARRRRIQELFAFEYLLECYKPKHKRKYGYYVLPLLWREQFVGRIDAKASRKQRTLAAERLMLQSTFRIDDAFLPSLAETLANLAAFTGCARVDIVHADSARLRDELRQRARAMLRAVSEQQEQTSQPDAAADADKQRRSTSRYEHKRNVP